MNSEFSGANGSFRLPGGRTGVLFIHGFTGTPESIAPWARGVHEQGGFTVHLPALAGHATSWQDLNSTTWHDWYDGIEEEFFELKKSCDRVFVAGFSVGGALALRLAQLHGEDIEALLLLNPSIYDEKNKKFYFFLPLLKYLIPSLNSGVMDVKRATPKRLSYERLPLKALDSLRKLWRTVESNLYKVSNPLFIGYSLEDHVVDPLNSETIINNVLSHEIREVIFEDSYHNVAVDNDAEILISESVAFIQDVLTGELGDSDPDLDERDLIDAEFDAIVSGLSLDTSTGSTYLDELDRIDTSESFIAPNPTLPRARRENRAAMALVALGPILILLATIFGIDPLGLGIWPGLILFVGGVARLIYLHARPFDDGEDGAEL